MVAKDSNNCWINLPADSASAEPPTPTADSADDANEKTALASDAPASGDAEMSVDAALDFIHGALSAEEQPILDRLEEEMVRRTLAAVSGNQVKAAERLGMTRTTLRKRIETYGLRP